MSPINFKYDPYMGIPDLIEVNGNHYTFKKDTLEEVEAILDEMGMTKSVSFRILMSKFGFKALFEKNDVNTTPDENGNIILGKFVMPKELFDLCVEKWIK